MYGDNNILSKISDILLNQDFATVEKDLFNLLETNPKCSTEIAISLAKLYTQKNLRAKGAELLAKIYNADKDKRIYDLLLSDFSNVNTETCKENYYNNIAELNKRKFVYYKNENNSYEDIIEFPIWVDDKFIIICKAGEVIFHTYPKYASVFRENTVYLFKNELKVKSIRLVQKATYKKDPMPLIVHPLYYYYDEWVFKVFLQVSNLKLLADSDRYVFIVGIEEYKEFFSEPQSRIPVEFFGINNEDAEIIRQIRTRLNHDIQSALKRINDYYTGNGARIRENIKSGKPKILFWTSLFSTAVQYRTRDSLITCQELGCGVGLVKEISPIHIVANTYILEIDKLKPDIIFIIDWFRQEFQFIPDEVYFVTWIQDDMPKFYDKNVIAKLDGRDLIMNQLIGLHKLRDIGYDSNRMMEAIVPANHNIYKPYTLTFEENEEYKCDVCILGNIRSISYTIEEFCYQYNITDSNLKKFITDLFYSYDKMALEGDILYTQNDFKQYIEKFRVFSSMRINDSFINIISEYMYSPFNYFVFRTHVADWLIDSGITNLKLWGNGWDEIRFKQYSMGFAENGVTLSKIYQASKIVLGVNVNASGAGRAWEAILSGTFYLSNYLSPEIDVIDIRSVLKENRELIMFNNKLDLIKKVNYYLQHEDERKELAAKARDTVLNKMTYTKIMCKMLDKLKSMAYE